MWRRCEAPRRRNRGRRGRVGGATMNDRFDFTLNGATRSVQGEPANRPLLDYLRATGLTGSKEGCAEGDCGACTVAHRRHATPTASARYRAINSCIALLPMVAGREIVTVEGVGSREGGLHPVQARDGRALRLAVRLLHAGLHRVDVRGLLPRRRSASPGTVDRPARRQPLPLHRLPPHPRRAWPSALALPRRAPRRQALPDRSTRSRLSPRRASRTRPPGRRSSARPRSPSCSRLRARYPEAELVGGATEIGVYINKKARRLPALISTEGVAELRARHDDRGDAGASAARPRSPRSKRRWPASYPSLAKMLRVFASRPDPQPRDARRQPGDRVAHRRHGAGAAGARRAGRAPIGSRGARELPLDAFFTGYRKTVLADGRDPERRPRAPGDASGGSARAWTRSYKVSKRRELDISIVAAAFASTLDAAGVVRRGAPRLRRRRGHAAARARGRGAARGQAAGPRRRVRERAARCSPRELLAHHDARAGAELPARAGRRACSRSSGSARRASGPGPAARARLGYTLGAPRRRGPARAHARERGRPRHRQAPSTSTTRRSAAADARDVAGVLAARARADPPARRDGGARACPASSACSRPRTSRARTTSARCARTSRSSPSGEVLFHGQMVAIVVGESLRGVPRGGRPGGRRVRAAAAPSSTLGAGDRRRGATTPSRTSSGAATCDAALAASPHRLDGELDIGGQEHFYLETQAAWAERGDDGDVFVCSSTQHPSEIQAVVVARAPPAAQQGGRAVAAHGRRLRRQGDAGQHLGGARRARRVEDRAPGARAARPRPRHDSSPASATRSSRASTSASTTTGASWPRACELVSDGGWALDLSESICDRALFHLDNAYYIPASHFSGRVGAGPTSSRTPRSAASAGRRAWSSSRR